MLEKCEGAIAVGCSTCGLVKQHQSAQRPSSYREHGLRKRPQVAADGGIAPALAMHGALAVQAHAAVSPCQRLATGVTLPKGSPLLPLVDHAILQLIHSQPSVSKVLGLSYCEMKQVVWQLLISPPLALALVRGHTAWV